MTAWGANKNWVTDILDNAARTVESWPAWMRSPDVRSPAPEQPQATELEGGTQRKSGSPVSGSSYSS